MRWENLHGLPKKAPSHLGWLACLARPGIRTRLFPSLVPCCENPHSPCAPEGILGYSLMLYGQSSPGLRNGGWVGRRVKHGQRWFPGVPFGCGEHPPGHPSGAVTVMPIGPSLGRSCLGEGLVLEDRGTTLQYTSCVTLDR